MMNSDWTPPTVDVNRPSAARVYDYLLGGGANFAADRRLGDELLARDPSIQHGVRENRRFVTRVVRHLARVGHRRFLDIGCGLPTVGPVHEIVQHETAAGQVVYVDNEPVALAHGRAMVADVPRATVIDGDLRRPADILADPAVMAMLNYPVVLVLAAVMHFVRDSEGAVDIMKVFRDSLVPGSVLVFSHVTSTAAGKTLSVAADLYDQTAQNHTALRSWEQIRALLDGYTLVTPGLTWVTEWYPEQGALRAAENGVSSHMLGTVAMIQ